MNKLFKIFSKYQFLIIISLFFVLALIYTFWQYDANTRFYIIAKFADSGPLYKNMPVFYKGYDIGHIKKINISPDYKYSLARMEFYPKNPKLYDNIVAKAKKLEEKDDYIDLIYPDPPSETLLKKGGVIEGRGAFDMDLFLSDVAEADILVPLLQNFSDVLVSAEKTSDEIKKFFSDARLILKDNRQNLNITTQNIAQTSKSLRITTSNFNNSITRDKLNSTTSNVYKSSDNILSVTESIKNITQNVDSATKNLDKTIAKVDCTITEANIIATNIRVITTSLCNALGKRFAGLKILFGKPMNNQCPKKCGST